MKSPTSVASSVAQRLFRASLCLPMLLASLLTVGPNSSPARAQNTIVLVGSGSSVPAPLYSRWTQEYGKRNASIQLRYVPIGTSVLNKEIIARASDFGAKEAQLTWR